MSTTPGLELLESPDRKHVNGTRQGRMRAHAAVDERCTSSVRKRLCCHAIGLIFAARSSGFNNIDNCKKYKSLQAASNLFLALGTDINLLTLRRRF